MWTWKRGGDSQVYILLDNPYLGSKMVHKEGGGQKKLSTWFMDGPLSEFDHNRILESNNIISGLILISLIPFYTQLMHFWIF